MDDLKSSNIDPKVNDEFLPWIKDTFGQLREVKTTQGPLHNYLGMTLDYSVPGQVSIDMSHYVDKIVKEFPQENLKGASVDSPWNENLSKVQHNSAPLQKEQAKVFHTVTTQGLFLCKHGHLDIAPAIAYLTTWVQKPNHADWTKLCQMMQFLKQTVKDKLTLRADCSGCLSWHCDAAFALHNDLRSHTGSTFSMGNGAITSLSRKQGMNRTQEVLLKQKC